VLADTSGGDEQRGTVAMGNQGPGTNGSEFFVVHTHANIPPYYTVLGHVISCMDTFDRIVAAGIDPDLDGPPTYPVRIYQVKVGAQHG
jgi:peptidyl-prolyl cis-trans isomerase B (cyclophilin B)